jgi:hypothetical protein
MRIKRLVIFLFFFALILLVGCPAFESFAPLIIENDTDQTLTIYVAVSGGGEITDQTPRDMVGIVQPATETRFDNVAASLSIYLFEARNSQNQIVYNREFTREELKKIQWKIVVSTSQ